MAWLVGLYVVAFLVEMAGVVLVVIDITGDIRTASVLRVPPPAPPASVETVSFERLPNGTLVERRIGGLFAQATAQNAQQTQRLEDVTIERLDGSLTRRWVAVGLVVLGAALGLVANLVSLAVS